jgi:choline dehydrogenase-like flavoprotein
VTTTPYHYIIVGGGSAGCVLANRLSADARYNVLLLEAGPPDDHWVLSIPTGVVASLMKPEFSWGYESTPQSGLENRPFPIPRGRVLGGSSSVNGMVYFRGHPGDYDDWAHREGARGWSYAEVLPYFCRSEDNRTFAGSPYHGASGEMSVTNSPRPNRLSRSFLEATKSLGLPECVDFNGPDPEGCGMRQATIRNGRRESMATAFLHPVRHRANLEVKTGVVVDRVLIENGRATGVRCLVDNQVRDFHAAGEVILSAGAYGSPAVLQRSGVGDAEELAALGVKVQHHLPAVGRGLRDHPNAAVQVKTDRDHTSYGVSARAMLRNIGNVLEYVLWRGGPVGSSTFEATGFLRSDPSLARPDLQLVFMPAHRGPKMTALPMGHGYGVLSILVRPKSHGRVTIASADPLAKPLIDPRFYEDPDDIDVVRKGLLLARQIVQHPAFNRYGGHEILPGPDVKDDAALTSYIRRTSSTVHHPGCTCRMGDDPSTTVVDHELKVRGIAGLRVADASVFPTLIAGNTNAAVVMIAEKAADMLLGKAAPAPVRLPRAAL